MGEPDWHLWRAFAAVLRAGSLSAASRSLGVPQPTLGRQIASLEAALGVALFTRSREGLAPTSHAGRLAASIAAMEDAAGSLLRVVARGEDGGPLKGTVRVTASDMVAAAILPPVLAGIVERHAGLCLELAASDRIEDLLRRAADIAVRHVRPSQAALRARLLGTARLGLFAHERYLERRGRPDTIEALKEHVLIGWERHVDPERASLARAAGLPPGFTIRCSSDPLQWALIRAGAGIGVCQQAVAARDPALVPVLPAMELPVLPFWIAMHEDLASDPAVRTVFDAAAGGLRHYLDPTHAIGTLSAGPA